MREDGLCREESKNRERGSGVHMQRGKFCVRKGGGETPRRRAQDTWWGGCLWGIKSSGVLEGKGREYRISQFGRPHRVRGTHEGWKRLRKYRTRSPVQL